MPRGGGRNIFWVGHLKFMSSLLQLGWGTMHKYSEFQVKTTNHSDKFKKSSKLGGACATPHSQVAPPLHKPLKPHHGKHILNLEERKQYSFLDNKIQYHLKSLS